MRNEVDFNILTHPIIGSIMMAIRSDSIHYREFPLIVAGRRVGLQMCWQFPVPGSAQAHWNTQASH